MPLVSTIATLLITVKPTPTSGTLSKAAAQIGAFVSASECKYSGFIDDTVPTLVQASLKVQRREVCMSLRSLTF